MSNNPQVLKNILEAALLAAGEPLTLDRLQGLFAEADAPTKDELRAALATLAEDYAGRGIELREVGSGYRFQVKGDLAQWVSRLWEEKPVRYSRALLETLALIAYRQPITRGEIEDIRGVAVSTHIIKTLEEREWIRIVGHREVPGRPALFGTTRQFLDYFNLKGLDELPPLAEVRNLEEVAKALIEGELVGPTTDPDSESPAEPAASAEVAGEPADSATAVSDAANGETAVSDTEGSEAMVSEADEAGAAATMSLRPLRSRPPALDESATESETGATLLVELPVTRLASG